MDRAGRQRCIGSTIVSHGSVGFHAILLQRDADNARQRPGDNPNALLKCREKCA